MTSREEQSALTGLEALMKQDLTDPEAVPDEDLLAGKRQNEVLRESVPQWDVAITRALLARGWSYRQIAEATGVPHTTQVQRMQRHRD